MTKKKICKKCNKTFNKKHQFCQDCGGPLEYKKTWFYWHRNTLFIIVLIGTLIGGTIYGIRQYDQNQKIENEIIVNEGFIDDLWIADFHVTLHYDGWHSESTLFRLSIEGQEFGVGEEIYMTLKIGDYVKIQANGLVIKIEV